MPGGAQAVEVTGGTPDAAGAVDDDPGAEDVDPDGAFDEFDSGRRRAISTSRSLFIQAVQ